MMAAPLTAWTFTSRPDYWSHGRTENREAALFLADAHDQSAIATFCASGPSQTVSEIASAAQTATDASAMA